MFTRQTTCNCLIKVAVVAIPILAGLLTIEIALDRAFGIRFLRGNIYGIDVKGVIVDENGNGIEDAHVLIDTESASIEGPIVCFAVRTDSNGAFVAKGRSQRPLQRKVHVTAMGPGNLWGYSTPIVPELRQDSMVADMGTIQIVEAPELGSKPTARLAYESYCFLCNEIIFLDKGWRVADDRSVKAIRNSRKRDRSD
jgi:hypothetical protein